MDKLASLENSGSRGHFSYSFNACRGRCFGALEENSFATLGEFAGGGLGANACSFGLEWGITGWERV